MDTTDLQAAYNALPILTDAIPKLPRDSDVKFAQDLLAHYRRHQSLTPRQAPWVGKLIDRATTRSDTTSAVDQERTKTIGDVSALKALFDKAARHLQSPSVVFRAEGIGMVRVYISKRNSKYRGRTVVGDYGKFWPHAQDYGFVTLDGRFEPRQFVQTPASLLAQLQAFAADPIKYAKEYGRLTGKCCFCRNPLEDERSTSQGYGPICAERYDLPWGERPSKDSLFLDSDRVSEETAPDDSLFAGLDLPK